MRNFSIPKRICVIVIVIEEREKDVEALGVAASVPDGENEAYDCCAVLEKQLFAQQARPSSTIDLVQKKYWE